MLRYHIPSSSPIVHTKALAATINTNIRQPLAIHLCMVSPLAIAGTHAQDYA